MEIALGVLLGVLGVALAALAAYLGVRRARPGRPAAGSSPGDVDHDDLPGFLECPPGTAGSASPAATGWAVLAAPPPASPAVPRRRGGARGLALGALAAAGVLLVGLAVAALTGRDDAREPRPADGAPPRGRPAASADPSPGTGTAGELAGRSVPPGSDGVEGRLSFDGIVLERHAVGVTATYPRLDLTSNGERSLAHLELPTYHCLTGEAPKDPVGAGCRRSATEYADLDSPDLSVDGSDDRLRLAGEFRTYLRPNGGPPEWTGRTYRIEVSVTPAPGTAPDGRRPVEGSLELGSERTSTTPDPDANVLRRGR